LYGVLTLALIAAAGVLSVAGRGGELSGAALVGLVLAWHLREQTRLEGVGATLWTLEGMGVYLAMSLAFAVIWFVLWKVCRRRLEAPEGPSARRAAVRWIAAATAFFLMLAATFFGSNTLRWHLLRHNKMLGTAAFHLFAERVATIEAEAWARHGRGSPLGQPDWIFDLVTGAARDPAEQPATDDTETTAGAAGAVLPEAEVPRSESESRPDIVFVMLDTLRADGLEAYGGDPTQMPNLNRLAAESIVFTDVIANAPWTQPSVGSFFTGLVPEEHGIISVRFRLSSSAFTLAEVLQSQGYETAAFIANGVLVNPEAGYVRGFETFQYLIDRPLRYARANVVTDSVEGWLEQRHAADSAVTEVADAGPAGGSAGGSAERTRSTGVDAETIPPTAGDGARAPLFLYVHYFDPHVPYLSSDLEDTAKPPTSTADARRYYADELRFLDAELARLFEILDRQLPGARLVLLASDHGEEFGEHDGRGHSQTLYNEVLDIPVIVQARDAAGQAPSALIDAPLEGRDFFYLMVRSAIEPGFDVPAWARQTTRPARQSSLWFEKDPGRSVTVHYLLRPYRHRIFSRMIERDRWRLIWSAYGRTDELYDLRNDPQELLNIAASNPEFVESLKAELREDPRYWVRLEPMDLSRDAMENLRALGYIR
jgi:arylsulfatase A-like enzyme